MHLRPSHLNTACLTAVALFHTGCATSVPDSSARIVFPSASINGQPVRAILDTGTSVAVTLNSQEARRIGLRFAPSPGQFLTTPFEGLTPPVALTLGAENVTAPIPLFNKPRINADLLVGWQGVRDDLLLFLGSFHSVAIVTGDDGQVPDTTGWLKVKISATANDVLALEIPFPDGSTDTVLVDTGDPHGVALPAPRWQAWQAAHPLASLSTVSEGGVEDGGKVWESLADHFSLGALTLTNVPLRNLRAVEGGVGEESHFAGVLGLGALARMDLVVDGKHGFAYLHPLPPPGAGAAGTTNPPAAAADQNQDWTVVRQTGLNQAAFILSVAGYRMDNLDEAGAIADCTRAIALDPLDVDAWVLRAEARAHQKDHDGAIADCTRAIALDPRNVMAWGVRAVEKEKAENHAGAIADVTQIIALAPENASSFYGRGYARGRAGDYAGAVADYTRALEMDPKNVAACAHRGFVKAQTGDYPGALADFNHTLELDPNDAIDYGNRAMVEEFLGDTADALADYDQAITLPDFYSTSWPMGMGFDFLWREHIHGFAIADTTHLALHRQLLELQQGTAPADFSHTMGSWNKSYVWAKTIGQFLTGKLDETALLAAAEKSGMEPVPVQLCEAWYFAGRMRLLKGDQAGARDAFLKALATNQRDHNEYLFAQAALAHLAAAGRN